MQEEVTDGEKTPTERKNPAAHLVGHQFKSGNPGRPKGARNKLGEAFISALHDDFMQHGVTAIAEVREKRPQDYLKVCASLLPKEFTVNVNPIEEMTDSELLERIRDITGQVTIIDAGADGGVGDAADGIGAPEEAEPASELSPVPETA